VREHEFTMTAAHFDAVVELVREHSGIALNSTKRELVYSRLARRLRALHLDSFDDYLALLRQDPGAELEEFVNAITTNLTSFFREEHHFEQLAREVIPALLKRNAATRRIRIWSCASSTGEEPYSIAMVLREALGNAAGWDVRLLATDIDSNVVATAKAGIYREDRLERMSTERRRRFFEPAQDARGACFRVTDEVRSLITFARLNLMEPFPMKGPFDAIFCRNVVIYFDKETQRELFDRMADIQREGDWLFLGHSESLFRVSDRYELIGRTVYRKAR